jgi:hypothetical protein
VLLSTPLHASSNFTPFAECICTACKYKGIKKNVIAAWTIENMDRLVQKPAIFPVRTETNWILRLEELHANTVL